ncbi:hypothetical protein NBH00_00105 [Paraconexibacter antarcticus]|uniref:Blue (type 1) copper domain-containing protein n=1 Tax=Paraconexibacter antarcticus TaxID=2949664 RepID=A0ABY5DRH1_9ACTN|nr:hypothetical protein [Paraconexibacter antarcticus]UTI64628.1 hypothetical protein NBH00_00105 [Paraconexibacter antarcticus]
MRRRRRLAAAVLAGAAGLAPVAARAQEHHMPPAGPAVSIGYVTYGPARVDVLVGEPVTWTNDSVRKHSVTADDASFDSGALFGADHFTRVFAAEGEVAYHCVFHAGMTGVVGVHEVILDAPRQEGAPNRPYPVTGRSALPAGTDVAIEADTGAGFVPVAATSVGLDGSFATTVRPVTSGQLRAVAAGATSPPVGLQVLDHRIAFTVRRTARADVLTATVTPAAPGGTVVLQLDLREHFGWWPVRTLRLDRRGHAVVRLPRRPRARARMVLTLRDGATPLAVSPPRTVGRPGA